MSTEQLIGRLVRDARPVKRSARPLVLFAWWSVASLLCLAVGVLMFGARENLGSLWQETGFIVHTLLVFSVTLLSAAAAFTVSIPDRRRRFIVGSSAIALAAWLVWIITVLTTSSESYTGHGWICLRNIAVLSVPLVALTCLLINRAAPLRAGMAGWLGVLSAVAAADLATRFVCRNDHALHALIWHFAPVLVLGVAGALLGRFAFRWQATDEN
jgi:hypothetical protein